MSKPRQQHSADPRYRVHTPVMTIRSSIHRSHPIPLKPPAPPLRTKPHQLPLLPIDTTIERDKVATNDDSFHISQQQTCPAEIHTMQAVAQMIQQLTTQHNHTLASPAASPKSDRFDFSNDSTVITPHWSESPLCGSGDDVDEDEAYFLGDEDEDEDDDYDDDDDDDLDEDDDDLETEADLDEDDF